MNEEMSSEVGVEPKATSIDSHRGRGSKLDEELSKVQLVNVRVLANKAFCQKVTAALEPLGLVVTGFEPDPQGTPNTYRLFLVGRGE